MKSAEVGGFLGRKRRDETYVIEFMHTGSTLSVTDHFIPSPSTWAP